MKRPNIPENSPFNSDFIALKGFDRSCILGPFITPASQIGNATNLSMKLWIDDELKQDSNSSRMIFSAAEQIAYLSERVTLLPGGCCSDRNARGDWRGERHLSQERSDHPDVDREHRGDPKHNDVMSPK